MQEIYVWSLGGEDPLEAGTETHSGILAWRIPWTEETDELQSIWSQRVRNDPSDLAWTYKHQQPQKCRWYHSNGRKWRGTKEPLDEGERGEWKDMQVEPIAAYYGNWHTTAAAWNSCTYVPATECVCVWVCMCVCVCVCVCEVASVMSNSLQPYGLQLARLLCPWDSRQESWTGSSCPSPGDLPNPGIEPISYVSCIHSGCFSSTATWESSRGI